MKILINTPFLSSPAGVSNHYLGLRPYFTDDVKYNQYFTTNYIKRKVGMSLLHKPIRALSLIYDIFKFTILLFLYRFPVVLLNPSFSNNALKRDAIFLRIAKMFNCKVSVFIHGWDIELVNKAKNGEYRINPVWEKVDLYFVLAEEFQIYLRELGISCPVYLTSTKVDDRIIRGSNEPKNKAQKTLLFLARIEAAKGIFTTIDAFKVVSNRFPDLHLRIVGMGTKLEEARQYVSQEKINNITFTGPLYGEDIVAEYLNADIYILPTTHGEGMPTTVLEAMAFGLPVITRPVGGLIDFFQNEKMGFMVESLKPEDYAQVIIDILDNPLKRSNMSKINREYAQQHFLASKVAGFLETKIKAIKN